MPITTRRCRAMKCAKRARRPESASLMFVRVGWLASMVKLSLVGLALSLRPERALELIASRADSGEASVRKPRRPPRPQPTPRRFPGARGSGNYASAVTKTTLLAAAPAVPTTVLLGRDHSP